jgi:hypothetical protein
MIHSDRRISDVQAKTCDVLFKFNHSNRLVPMHHSHADSFARKGKGQIYLMAPPADVDVEITDTEEAKTDGSK